MAFCLFALLYPMQWVGEGIMFLTRQSVSLVFCQHNSSKTLICRCAYLQEIQIHLFGASYAPFELRNFAKIKCTSEIWNGTQMWQLLIYYMYPIITVIWLWFSVELPIIYAWHCHLLYAALSSNVGACGMWACSLFLSFGLIFPRKSQHS